MAEQAAFNIIEAEREPVLALSGDWTVDTIAPLDAPLREASERIGPAAALDVARLGRLDVAGAYLIDRTLRGGLTGAALPLKLRGAHPTAQRLIEAHLDALAAAGVELVTAGHALAGRLLQQHRLGAQLHGVVVPHRGASVVTARGLAVLGFDGILLVALLLDHVQHA